MKRIDVTQKLGFRGTHV